MRLASFRTVRGRLLALLIGIALPIACLTALTAVTTYQTVTSGIETAQKRTGEDFAIRTSVWYRGVMRSLLASGATLAREGADAESCSAGAARVLDQVRGYRALYIVGGGSQICTASSDSTVQPAALAQAMAELRNRPSVALWEGARLSHARYDSVAIGGRRHLAVYARDDDPSKPFREGILLIEPELLHQIFNFGDVESGLQAALVNGEAGVIVARGASGADMAWLPAQEKLPADTRRWTAQSRGGESRIYTARMVADPDLYVIASFDKTLDRAARTQFLVLLLAPLLTLVLLCLVYLRAIDRHCIHWLRNIEAAARARTTLSTARAVVAPDMPFDIRSVAEAFNTMVDEQEVRQRKLQTALDDNRFLVRELHHRVKNSLQVVQSYIGLTKRDYRGEARMALADAECRVHVLSAAYRFTLADGEMQPVRVELFIEDVATMIANLLDPRDGWLSCFVETTAVLPVDRIIPLGFLIVDVASRALRSAPGLTLRLQVVDLDPQTIEIVIEADREVAHQPPPKLFAGLLAQVEAVLSRAPQGRLLGAWRVRHRA
ncbi:MAG: sensor histidine kinase [Bosea sp. (in: a-proteobacteria)]